MLKTCVVAALLLLCVGQVEAAASTSQSEAARRLYRLVGGDRLIEQTYAVMLDAMKRQNPDIGPYEAVVKEWFSRVVTRHHFEDQMAEIYAEAFSEQELNELIAFYGSPIGQKALTKMPAMMRRATEVGAEMLKESAPELEEMIAKRKEELAKQPLSAAPLSSSPAKASAKAKIVTFGLYRNAADPNASLPLELSKQTTTVEACLKAWFGYQLLVSGLAPEAQVTFRKVVTYPPMHKPDGTTSTGYDKAETTEVRSDGTVSTHQGYGLDHGYETVPGKWTIEFWYGSQRLASKIFTLVPCKTP